MGCLRLTKGLAKILRGSHPRIMAEEWVLGKDQKFKYFKGIRIETYRTLIRLLESRLPDKVRIVLSTETPEVWVQSGLPFKTMPGICETGGAL